MTTAPHRALPAHADTIIIGGGTAGAVVAGRLALHSTRSILVLEAGPDYGALAAGGWPQPLVDARALPVNDHDWQYVSSARHGVPGLRLERARVIGGCSAHNGCIAFWGSRADYDNWAARGNEGWDAETLLPYFHRVTEQMRVSRHLVEDLTPFHRAVLEAAPGVGIPIVEDLNNLDESVGAAASAVNIVDHQRWNTAFAYLDPVRERPNLTICGHVEVNRLVLEQDRVVAVEVHGPAGPARIETSEVVLCAGAYGSPAILLRSGIGNVYELATLGLRATHHLPGVGENLHDHPAFYVGYSGTPALSRALEEFGATGKVLYDEQTLIKARSSYCQEAFDLHIYPAAASDPTVAHDSPSPFFLPVAVMNPRSRGSVKLASLDPQVAPILDHGYLTDKEGRDLTVLLDGIGLVRRMAAQAPLAQLIGEENAPGLHLQGADLAAFVQANAVHYYHPVGTCAMGPASDGKAVVDSRGRVHGVQGIRVADAALMPVIPRANTNIPVIVVAERIADLMLG